MINISEKQYPILVVSTILLIMLSAGLINYIIDPAHLYRGGTYEHGIAELLHQEKNVANVSNYDERLLQKFYVESLENKKKVLVLGSSRSMQIRSELFKPYSFFNSSVSGCSEEDFLAIFYMFYKKGFVPDKVILGIDPWVFNENSNQTRWRVIQQYYYDMLSVIDQKEKIKSPSNLNSNKLKQLVSWGYLKKSLLLLLSRQQNKENRKFGYYPINDDNADVTIKRSDGSLYEAGYERWTTDEVNKKVFEFTIKPYSLQKFNIINMKAKDNIEKFILFLKNLNIEVIIFLAPYHPYVYKYLVQSGDKKIVADVESSLRILARVNNISIKGSYDPSKNNCIENEFYDGMHPQEVCVNRIFQEKSDNNNQ